MNASTPTPAFLLYCATAGINGPFDPHYVFTWRIERERDETPLADNLRDEPSRLDGDVSKGFYAGIKAGLSEIAANNHHANVTVIAPKGSELYWVFKDAIEHRVATGYRKAAGGKKALRPNHLLIREVDQLCQQYGLTLTSRSPVTNHEIETRYLLEDEAKARLKVAWAAEESSAA